MKHLTTTLVVLTATLPSCVDTIVDNDLTRVGMKGDVKEIKQEKWTAVEKFGEPTPDEKVKSYEEHFTTIFNEFGNVSETQHYFPNGNLAYVTKNEFNEQNNKTETSMYDNNGDLQGKITYMYDKEKNICTKTVYDKDGNSIGYAVNQENEKGDLVKSEFFSNEDSLQNMKEWTYNYNGYKSTEMLYDSKKQYEGKGEFSYDENWNVLEHGHYTKDDSLIRTDRFEYEFDEKGNWVKAIMYTDEKLKYIKLRTFEYYSDTDKPSTPDKAESNETTGDSNNNGNPKGLYKNVKGGIYSAFEFKGESTVIIHGLGMQFASSYVRDGNLLRMRTDKSDLLLQIKDDKTLIGEGFAKGEYKKE